MKKLSLFVLCALVTTKSYGQDITIPNSLNLDGYRTFGQLLTTEIEGSELKDVFDVKNVGEQKNKVVDKYAKQIEACGQEVDCLKSVFAKRNSEIIKIDSRVSSLNNQYGSVVKSLNASLITDAVASSIKINGYFEVLPQTLKITKVSNDSRLLTVVVKNRDYIAKLLSISILIQGENTLDKLSNDVKNLGDGPNGVAASMQDKLNLDAGSAIFQSLSSKESADISGAAKLKVTITDLK